MNLARNVADVLAEHVTFEIECIDRMYCNVYVPRLQYPAGLVGYVHHQLGLPIASTAPLGQITERFTKDVRAFARRQQIPCELTSWTLRRNWGGRAPVSGLTAWRRHVVTLPFDDVVATTWGTLDARAQDRGRPRPINDMWVAACCIAYGVPLATLNVKDFEDFARHDGLALAGV